MDLSLTGAMKLSAPPAAIRALQNDIDAILSFPERRLCDDTHKTLMLLLIDRVATALTVSGELPAAITTHLVKAHKGAIDYEARTVFRHLCEAVDIYVRHHLPRIQSPTS